MAMKYTAAYDFSAQSSDDNFGIEYTLAKIAEAEGLSRAYDADIVYFFDIDDYEYNGDWKKSIRNKLAIPLRELDSMSNVIRKRRLNVHDELKMFDAYTLEAIVLGGELCCGTYPPITVVEIAQGREGSLYNTSRLFSENKASLINILGDYPDAYLMFISDKKPKKKQLSPRNLISSMLMCFYDDGEIGGQRRVGKSIVNCVFEPNLSLLTSSKESQEFNFLKLFEKSKSKPRPADTPERKPITLPTPDYKLAKEMQVLSADIAAAASSVQNLSTHLHAKLVISSEMSTDVIQTALDAIEGFNSVIRDKIARYNELFDDYEKRVIRARAKQKANVTVTDAMQKAYPAKYGDPAPREKKTRGRSDWDIDSDDDE